MDPRNRGAGFPLRGEVDREVEGGTLSALAGPRARMAALAKAVTWRIRRQPALAMACALAAGFVIGGGLSFRGGRMLLGGALRHAGRDVLKQLF